MRFQIPVSIRCILAVPLLVSCLVQPLQAAETAAQRDERMAWWREARFGMFIHWGLYAIPAGSWNGTPVGGIGEWIMDKANIPVEDYEKLAGQFNPTAYDADAWVRLAKEAGMKYLVITSKHHDGFGLFDSEATDYNVVDASPYGKDLLAPLAAACRKHGLKFCAYYSIMDWHHPAQYRNNEKRYNPTKIHPEQKQDYIAFMHKQLDELLNTCDPEVLWFDGEWPDWFNREDGWDLYRWLMARKSSLIVNNRVGSGRDGMAGFDKDDKYAGDFGTPEQEIPATGLPGVDWESCMTMNDTWGFKKSDHKWKSPEKLIHNLVDISSKGGNFLLNVGPTAKGAIPSASMDRLKTIGQWMDINSQSIHGTQANPFPSISWNGRCTMKVDNNSDTQLFFHLFEWPKDGKLNIPELQNPIQAVSILGQKTDNLLPVSGKPGNWSIQLPEAPTTSPENICTVVKVSIKGVPNIVTK